MPAAVQAAAALLCCPHLGLADDDATHCSFSSPAHRCFRPQRPPRIGLDHQVNVCLTADYVICPVFRGLNDLPPGGSVARRRSLVLPGGIAAVATVAALVGLRVLMNDAPAQATTTQPVAPTAAVRGISPGDAPAQSTPRQSASPTDGTTRGVSPAATSILYRVRMGDTLPAVAAFFGSRPDDVIRLNGLSAEGTLTLGQELIMPVGP